MHHSPRHGVRSRATVNSIVNEPFPSAISMSEHRGKPGVLESFISIVETREECSDSLEA